MTMAQRKKRYRLYAMGRTRKTEEIAYDTRFYRICAGYILLYLTGRKKPEGAVEVAGADLDRLTDGGPPVAGGLQHHDSGRSGGPSRRNAGRRRRSNGPALWTAGIGIAEGAGTHEGRWGAWTCKLN